MYKIALFLLLFISFGVGCLVGVNAISSILIPPIMFVIGYTFSAILKKLKEV